MNADDGGGFGGFGDDDDTGLAVGGWDDADLDAQLAALDQRDAVIRGGNSPVNWKEAIEAEEDEGAAGVEREFPAMRPASGDYNRPGPGAAARRNEPRLNSSHGQRPRPTAARAAEPEPEPEVQQRGGGSRSSGSGSGGSRNSSRDSSRGGSRGKAREPAADARSASRGERRRDAAAKARALIERRQKGDTAAGGLLTQSDGMDRRTAAAASARAAAPRQPARPRQPTPRRVGSAGPRPQAGGKDGALLFRMGATGQGAVVLRKVLGEATNWAEVEETEGAAPDGGLARSSGLKLPSVTDGRGRSQAPVEGPYWNLTWRTGRFAPSEYANCNGSCRVNHIPKSSAICKKDNLVRHCRKARGVFGPIYNFLPTSFLVPTEYTKFAEHFSDLEERGEKSTWICKPTGMSRGRKIFLLDDLSGLAYDRACVVQRYIPRPLLIGGYKMDIRLYVVVTSARPLRAFIYQEGLARFSTEKYDMSDLSNVFSHLTNYSVNKDGANYEADKDVIGGGAKWLFTKLMKYLAEKGHDTGLLWTRIRHVCILTCLILMPLVPDEASGCFELFGFDILVDEALHPWLLEVNAAPALAAGSDVDWAVKEPLLRDLIGLLEFNNAGTHDALDRPPSKKNKPGSRKKNKSVAGARPRSGRPAGGRRASDADVAGPEAGADEAGVYGNAAKKFGGYEMIFPFNKKMADVSEMMPSGVGGKVVAEQGQVIRTIVEEVRKLEEEASVKAVDGYPGAAASGASRRLLHRDIETDPSLPGRKEGAVREHARRNASRASSAAMVDDGGSGLTAASGGGSAAPRAQRFDLAASLADTDAQIAALMSAAMPV